MEDGNGAIWTDAGCRQVHLEFLPHVAHEESPRPPGEWALISDNNCTFSPLVDVPCFAYHPQDNGGVLNLLTVGLGQRDAARIVAGIPLDAEVVYRCRSRAGNPGLPAGTSLLDTETTKGGSVWPGAQCSFWLSWCSLGA